MYTIKSARYSNPEETEVVIVTEEAAEVAVNERDNPELWKQLMDSGVTIEPMPREPVIDPAAPTVIRGS